MPTEQSPKWYAFLWALYLSLEQPSSSLTLPSLARLPFAPFSFFSRIQAVYNYALSSAQVANHYAVGVAKTALPPPPPAPPAPPASGNCTTGGTYRKVVLADSPWAWWRLQETVGTVAFDCSRNGTHSGTYLGGMTLGYAGRGAGNAASVAALSDGSTGYVLLPTIPGVQSGGPFSAGGYSMEAWAYSTSISGWLRFFTSASAGAGTFHDVAEFGWVSSWAPAPLSFPPHVCIATSLSLPPFV